MIQAPSAPPWWRLLNRHHWFVFSVASLAWFFDCLDQQFFNLARDAAMEQLIPEKATEYGPYTTSIFLIGWAVGGLTFGALGDRYGRARFLAISVFLYSVFTGLSALSTGFVDFCIYRFLTGLGVGGVFGLAVALVADTVPEKARAPALGLLQSLSTWGNILAGLIGMGVGVLAARSALPFGLESWQTLFLIGAIPAFFCVFIIRKLPDGRLSFVNDAFCRTFHVRRENALGRTFTPVCHPQEQSDQPPVVATGSETLRLTYNQCMRTLNG